MVRFWRGRLGTRFLIVLGAGSLMALFAVLMLPKIWLSTPADSDPKIRISLIDMLQARSLAKSARAQEAAQHPTEAFQSWRSAIANNPGDPSLTEGLIQFVLRQEHPEPTLLMGAASQASWLMHLLKTNEASVHLTGRIYARAGFYEEAWHMLASTNNAISPDVAKVFAISAFEIGRFDAFRQTWLQNESLFKNDPELLVYQAAWTATLGAPADGISALNRLREACESKDVRILALRLKCLVEAHRLDSLALDATLKALQDARGDRLEDHVRSWTLHNYLGHRNVAIAAARAYPALPKTNREATLALQVWSQMGLDDLIAEFARNQLGRFEHLPELWVSIALDLIKSKRWDDVRALAASIRSSPRLSGALGGFIDFMEGMVESGTLNSARAEELFKNVLKKRPSSPVLTYSIADALISLGHHPIAFDLLEPMESSLGDRPDYWHKMIQCSHSQRRAERLLSVTRKAHQRFPKNLALANDYAAALLILNQESGEAVRITLEVQKQFPSTASRINHAIALIRNSRLEEAKQLLKAIPGESLPHDQRSFWHLALFEAAVAASDHSLAEKEFARVDSELLFPEQRLWAKQALDQLPKL